MTAPTPPPGYKAEAVAVVRSWVHGAPVICTAAKIVEVGAGLGVVTHAMASILDTRIHAYEPIPAMAAAADDHTQQFPNVRVIPAAVVPTGYPDTSISLFEMTEPWNSGSAPPPYDTVRRVIEAPAVQLAAALDAARADTLVLDAEGAECDLLTGLIPLTLTTLIVEWHPHIVGDARVNEARAHLADIGFHQALRVPGELRPGGFHELCVYAREVAW